MFLRPPMWTAQSLYIEDKMQELRTNQVWVANDSSAEAKILAINGSKIHFEVKYKNISFLTKSETRIDDFRRRFPRQVK